MKFLKVRFCIFIFIANLFIFDFAIADEVIVETTNGLVKGRLDKTVELKINYHSFLGIPYAEPPLGNLRFENPLPKSNWSGTLDGTKYASQCVQGSEIIEGDEDCLFINIFTPNLPSSNNSKKLPVIIWIHGGGFIEGSANLTDTKPDYFLDKGIVFVAIQYRLGVFGFLSTGDQVMPGNTALKDQVLAIKWINKNVERFGGDPKNVALFGQSAGSASISYLMQSRKVSGLYNRAIMDSGTSLSFWCFCRNAPQFAKSLVASANSTDLIAKLKSQNYKELQKVFFDRYKMQLLLKNPLDGLPIGPVQEPANSNAVISDKSYELVKAGKVDKVPILIGHNSLEISLALSTFTRLYVSKYDLLPSLLVPIDMNIKNPITLTLLGYRIKQQYFGLIPIIFSEENFAHFVSDGQFVRPIQKYVELYSKYAPTYYYQFNYEGGLYGVENRTFPGTVHTEELGYLFKMNHTGSNQDNLVRKTMVDLWTNFAKYGNPTPANSETNYLNWPTVKSDSRILNMQIGSTLKLNHDLREKKMDFWDNLYNNYGIPPYDTY